MIKDGIYINKGQLYEEMHGGIRTVSQKINLVYIVNNIAGKKSFWWYLDKPFDYKKVAKDFEGEILGKQLEKLWELGCVRGKYFKSNNKVEISYLLNTKLIQEIYTAYSNEVILDDNMSQFEYVDVEKIS